MNKIWIAEDRHFYDTSEPWLYENVDPLCLVDWLNWLYILTTWAKELAVIWDDRLSERFGDGCIHTLA